MFSSSQKPKKTGSVIERIIGDELILVPLRPTPDGPDHIFTVNSVGRQIWTLIDGRRTVAQIAKKVGAEYDEPAKEVQADVREFLSLLVSENIIKMPPAQEGG